MTPPSSQWPHNPTPTVIESDQKQHPTQPQAHLITVTSDAQSVMRFLSQTTTSGELKFAKTTRAAYEKECRRLLWYCGRHNLHFQALTLEDAQAFAQILKSPDHNMIGMAKRPFGDKGWKPFVVSKDWGPGDPVLSPASIHQAIAAIKSLFTWLQKVGYLVLNPFSLLDTNSQEKKRIEMTRKNRVLHIEDIRYVLDYLEQAEREALTKPKILRKVNRQRWLFYAYLYSGLRISEFLRNDTSSLQLTSVNEKKIWVLHIIGKGGKPSEIPVSEGFIDEFNRYQLSLESLDASSEPKAFFYNVTGKKPVTSRQKLHDIFKELIGDVADSLLAQNKLQDSLRLRASSVHWLRHSFVTLALDETHDLAAVMELARHSNINTTMGYDKSRMGHLYNILAKVDHRLLSPKPE